jgi:hypothetical protein
MGDYPVFDRRGETLLSGVPTGRRQSGDKKAPRWGRVAGLIVIIMAVCGVPSWADTFFGGDQDRVTEIGVALDFENVFVNNLSPHVKPISALRMSAHFSESEHSLKNCGVEFILARRDGSYAATKWPGVQREVEGGGKNRITQLCSGDNSHLTGGSLPIVDDINAQLEQGSVFVALPTILSRLNGQISPQLGLSSALLVNATQYQAESNGGQKDGSESCNQRIVSVGESLAANRVADDNDADADSFIFVLAFVGGCLGFVLTYALLKRR